MATKKKVSKKKATQDDTKETKKVKKSTKASTKKEKTSTEGYGVAYLAKQLEKEPNLVRVALRNKGIKKTGKSYNWETKAEADKVVKQLKAD